MTAPNSQSSALAGMNPLEVWIYTRFLEQGFTNLGFIGWKVFVKGLITAQPNRAEAEIKSVLQK